MKPSEALQKLIERAIVIDHRKEPGAVVERAPKDVRKALEGLTSDDAANTRYPKEL